MTDRTTAIAAEHRENGLAGRSWRTVAVQFISRACVSRGIIFGNHGAGSFSVLVARGYFRCTRRRLTLRSFDRDDDLFSLYTVAAHLHAYGEGLSSVYTVTAHFRIALPNVRFFVIRIRAPGVH